MAGAAEPQAANGYQEKAIDWAGARRYWAFQAPKAPSRPPVRNSAWPRQPLDYFVLAKLEAKKLAPAPEADRRALIRRATFDLTGLPPTPEAVEAFLADRSPDAYAKLVEGLLASPAYGERMGSLWMPLARYGEDQAHQVGADTRFFYPNAYRYRDWVVAAFNRDLPYDRFARLQLAADKIEGVDKSDIVALGFLGLGPKYYNRNRLDVMADEWTDRVDTVTRTFLGLTVACARCHDHKYDPITQRDYYAFAGVFASTKMVNKTPDGFVDPASDQTKMRADTLHIVEDDKPTDLAVFIRGNVERPGPTAHRRFLKVLSADEPANFRQGSGRLEVADAIVDPNNPLTARVIVNRLWAHTIGQPLVNSPSNFGVFGDTPTHPELLDDLAVRFVKGGWSIKSLVREIVLSATYRQSVHNPKPAAADPANMLLWRANRRRLQIEQWRDALLAVSGTLETGGGPSQDVDAVANHKRTLYSRISRLKLNDLLRLFDYPDANVHAEKRSVTTTPLQKLFVLNNPLMLEQARLFAERVRKDAGENEADRVRRAYMLLYARQPEPAELQLGLSYLARPATTLSRWEQYAQVLLASNELLYLD